jgi:hypothetical protein
MDDRRIITREEASAASRLLYEYGRQQLGDAGLRAKIGEAPVAVSSGLVESTHRSRQRARSQDGAGALAQTSPAAHWRVRGPTFWRPDTC